MRKGRFEKQSPNQSNALRRCRKDQRPGRRAAPLRFESLEQRALLSVTITPTTFKDSNDPAKGSLRDAIIVANAEPGSDAITIQLKAGTYTLSVQNADSEHETESATGDLNITSTAHQLIIQGQGKAGSPKTIIRQTAADRVFEIVDPDVQVVFKNLVIERGIAADIGSEAGLGGGGILNNGGSVTLNNVIVRSNKASVPADSSDDSQGGGIYSQGGTLSLDTVTFSQNTATGGGNSQGGGIYAAETDITMTKVTFSKNTARGYEMGQGGGMYFENSSPDLTLALTSVTLSGNTASGDNGLNGRIVKIGTTTTIAEATDGGHGQGGGIYMNGGVATLSQVTFSGNVAQGGNGGNGLSSRGGGDGENGANGGVGQGGGMYMSDSSDSSAAFSEVIFSKNVARGGNGGKGGNASKSQPTPGGTSGPMGGKGGDGGSGGDGQGGGLYVGSGSVTLSKVTFSSNTAQAGNGGSGGKGVKVRTQTSSGGFSTSGGTGGAGGSGGNGQGGGMYIGAGQVTLDLGSVSKNVVKRGSAGKKGSGVPPEETGVNGTADGAGIAVGPDATFASTNTTFPRGQEPVDLDV